MYSKRNMDYTDLTTYNIQLRYIKKIYEINLKEIDYVNKITELKQS